MYNYDLSFMSKVKPISGYNITVGKDEFVCSFVVIVCGEEYRFSIGYLGARYVQGEVYARYNIYRRVYGCPLQWDWEHPIISYKFTSKEALFRALSSEVEDFVPEELLHSV